MKYSPTHKTNLFKMYRQLFCHIWPASALFPIDDTKTTDSRSEWGPSHREFHIWKSHWIHSEERPLKTIQITNPHKLEFYWDGKSTLLNKQANSQNSKWHRCAWIYSCFSNGISKQSGLFDSGVQYQHSWEAQSLKEGTVL